MPIADLPHGFAIDADGASQPRLFLHRLYDVFSSKLNSLVRCWVIRVTARAQHMSAAQR